MLFGGSDLLTLLHTVLARCPAVLLGSRPGVMLWGRVIVLWGCALARGMGSFCGAMLWAVSSGLCCAVGLCCGDVLRGCVVPVLWGCACAVGLCCGAVLWGHVLCCGSVPWAVLWGWAVGLCRGAVRWGCDCAVGLFRGAVPVPWGCTMVCSVGLCCACAVGPCRGAGLRHGLCLRCGSPPVAARGQSRPRRRAARRERSGLRASVSSRGALGPRPHPMLMRLRAGLAGGGQSGTRGHPQGAGRAQPLVPCCPPLPAGRGAWQHPPQQHPSQQHPGVERAALGFPHQRCTGVAGERWHAAPAPCPAAHGLPTERTWVARRLRIPAALPCGRAWGPGGVSSAELAPRGEGWCGDRQVGTGPRHCFAFAVPPTCGSGSRFGADSPVGLNLLCSCRVFQQGGWGLAASTRGKAPGKCSPTRSLGRGSSAEAREIPWGCS
ncbi:uncharacterized protein LOC128853646 [Cuculus canorus]|uniref:uncharacterized protein LOC128853646 n=1 Tax=Cuculus canorus TaxID=55661 RepID=UPI0023AA593E|nr:uncharacterized protein LOC128853646 [Cuculus canorus]